MISCVCEASYLKKVSRTQARTLRNLRWQGEALGILAGGFSQNGRDAPKKCLVEKRVHWSQCGQTSCLSGLVEDLLGHSECLFEAAEGATPRYRKKSISNHPCFQNREQNPPRHYGNSSLKGKGTNISRSVWIAAISWSLTGHSSKNLCNFWIPWGSFALTMVHVDYRAAPFEDQFSKATPLPASFHPPLCSFLE